MSLDGLVKIDESIKDYYKSSFDDLIIKELNRMDYYQLKDLQKLSEISKIYNIPRRVLDYRLKFFKEGLDYIKLGERQPTLLTPKTVERIINIKGVDL